MRPDEKSQIEILRVFCITAMMWVHVSPGLSSPSFVSTGDFRLVGLILGDTLGRISVSVLSFISGYLFWTSAASRPMLSTVRRRFVSVVLPMLVWSAIFIVMAESKQMVIGAPSRMLLGLAPTPMAFLNGWAGVAGPTANLSLFFLRDLFVATLILRLAAPLIRRLPLLMALLVTVLAVLEWTAPVVFRPAILQFMVLGAIASERGLSITWLSRPALSLPLGYGLALAGFAAMALLPAGLSEVHAVAGILRRLGIGFLALALSRAFLRLTPAPWMVRLGRHSYLAYLMHVPLIAFLWAFWVRIVGGPGDTPYLAFYLAMPPLVFAIARLAGQAIDRLPAPAQLLLRGKVHGPARIAPARLPLGGGGAI